MILFSKILRLLGYVYLFLSIIFILTNLYFIWVDEGFYAVQEILSPFNIINWVVTILTIAPGYLLLIASDWVGKKIK
jgi:hypothetical protein